MIFAVASSHRVSVRPLSHPMAQFGNFLTWANPTTPLTIKRPVFDYNTGPTQVPQTRQPLGDIARPLSETHFYGIIQFEKSSPDKIFDYSPPKKRPWDSSFSNENVGPTASSSSPSPSEAVARPGKRSKPNPPGEATATGSKKWKSVHTDAQKLETILETIQAQNWTLGCFLYNLFRTQNAHGGEIHRSATHSQMVSIFLAGRSKEMVADIISTWMAHPDGRIPENSPNSDLMYSTTIPYTQIGPVRAALTSFATQTMEKKVAVEAESAVKLGSGLHVSIGKTHPEMKLRHEDFGEATIP